MYKPLQKKSSSWTVTSIQKKSKSFSKPGSSAVQPKRDANSAQSQDMPSYFTAGADFLAGSIMRSVETEDHSEIETSTVQLQSEPGRAAVAATAPPIVSIPVVQPNSVGIQRQCSECAEKQQQQSGEEGKDVLEMSGAASGIQTKLTVGTPGDVYEQEADRVAAQVMSMPIAAAAPPQVQRFGVEDNPVGMYSSLVRSITPLVQRRMDEQVQMYSAVQRAFQSGGNQASGDLESRLNASKGGGSALAPEVRAFMEPRFGADFSSVRVHTGSEAVQMNRELGAQAFAHGSDVYFGAGKSPGNNELTAHELTHVVQQTGVVQARFSPATNMISKQESAPNETREQKLKKYHAAISQRDWEYASLILNGFNEADIRALVKKLNFADRVKMKNGALKSMPGWPQIVTKIIEEHNKDTHKRTIDFKGTSREEKALKRLQDYAVKFPKGPLTQAPDNNFGTRLQAAIADLKAEIEQTESFEKMPERLKGIVFTAEQLNLDPLKVEDKEWMTTTSDGTTGGRSKSREGSTSSYGENSWKCNKFVADAYASTEGAGVRTNYPLTKDQNNNWWGPQANDLASGKNLTNFPMTELVKLAEDGQTIMEVDEYNKMGQVTAKYKLDGAVFKKYEKKDKNWIETKQTKKPDELEPGKTAYIGDIVAFHNAKKGVSGHTGLNLGHDLFISALNATSGVGILSIKMHLDRSSIGWDTYNQVAFRSYSH